LLIEQLHPGKPLVQGDEVKGRQFFGGNLLRGQARVLFAQRPDGAILPAKASSDLSDAKRWSRVASSIMGFSRYSTRRSENRTKRFSGTSVVGGGESMIAGVAALARLGLTLAVIATGDGFFAALLTNSPSLSS
jgi:hypothetical protein